ncbi:MAG: alkaline phosphatase family protein [Candidatus Hodarchaeota archaeon]
MKKKEKTVALLLILIFSFGFSINFIAALIPQGTSTRTTPRVILISIDSANPEYLTEEMMPKLFNEIMSRGSKYRYALTALAAETQHGHTCMLTGAHPNNTGMIGNGLYINETGETIGVLTDPKYRLAETIIESLERTNSSLKTAFLSGKWRLPSLLANASDLVFASPRTGIPLPDGYEEKVGTPITYYDGDIVDSWVMNALIEVIKKDDPDFIFVNLAWTDVQGHYTGGIGDYSVIINQHLRELDDLFMRLFTELKAMGEYDNTLFAITSDHGMETVEDVVDIQGYLVDNGIGCHIHNEGGSGFVFLDNPSQNDTAVALLEQHPDVAVVVPWERMGEYPYHLNSSKNTTGDIYISTRAHALLSTYLGGLSIEYSAQGSHGGIALQDVVMGWMGPNIIHHSYELPVVPEVMDIVPTICQIMGWTPPAQTSGRILHEIIE